MGELALRGYNVALPEIDIGDDIFAVNDASGAMYRIQVKTAIAKRQNTGYRGQFRVRESSATTPLTPDLSFVFAFRLSAHAGQPERWDYVVMARSVFNNYVLLGQLGSRSTTGGVNWLTVGMTLKDSGPIVSGTTVLTHHRCDWATWPII